jgi:hypothetical protein
MIFTTHLSLPHPHLRCETTRGHIVNIRQKPAHYGMASLEAAFSLVAPQQSTIKWQSDCWWHGAQSGCCAPAHFEFKVALFFTCWVVVLSAAAAVGRLRLMPA